MNASPPVRRPRVAIVLFNLGGPDRPEAVRPFLENLFTDPAILRVPGFIRPWLGRFIAARRTKAASENYAVLGGRSPLLELTEEQGRTLEAALEPALDAKCFDGFGGLADAGGIYEAKLNTLDIEYFFDDVAGGAGDV